MATGSVADRVAAVPAASSRLPSVSSLTFTQGFLVGQASIVVVIILLIRYVIFEDAETALDKEREARLARTSRARKRYLSTLRQRSRSRPGVDKGDPRGSGPDGGRAAGATLAAILERVGYDLSSHGTESADWLNVVFAQAVAGYREDVLNGGVSHAPAGGEDGHRRRKASHDEQRTERTARDLMEDILNQKTSGKFDFLDPISVTEVDFGDQYPILSNARIRPADDTGRMRVEVDIDYSDHITMAIDTKLLINFPKPRFAVLPISLGLTIRRFSGTLAIELFSSSPHSSILHPTPTSNTPSRPRSRHELHFSLHPDFALDASATSLLGSRAKLHDVPKIEQILVGRLRSAVHDRFVWPRFWSLTLPNLVPNPAADRAAAAAAAAAAHAASADGQPARGAGGARTPRNEMRVGHGVEPADPHVIPPGESSTGTGAHRGSSGAAVSGLNGHAAAAHMIASRAMDGEGPGSSLFESDEYDAGTASGQGASDPGLAGASNGWGAGARRYGPSPLGGTGNARGRPPAGGLPTPPGGLPSVEAWRAGTLPNGKTGSGVRSGEGEGQTAWGSGVGLGALGDMGSVRRRI